MNQCITCNRTIKDEQEFCSYNCFMDYVESRVVFSKKRKEKENTQKEETILNNKKINNIKKNTNPYINRIESIK